MHSNNRYFNTGQEAPNAQHLPKQIETWDYEISELGVKVCFGMCYEHIVERMVDYAWRIKNNIALQTGVSIWVDNEKQWIYWWWKDSKTENTEGIPGIYPGFNHRINGLRYWL